MKLFSRRYPQHTPLGNHIGTSEPPEGSWCSKKQYSRGVCSCLCVSLLCGTLCIELSDRFPFELDAMGTVHDPVADCIRDRGVSDDLVPPVDGNLRDNDRGSSPNSVLKDLQQTETAWGIEGFKA